MYMACHDVVTQMSTHGRDTLYKSAKMGGWHSFECSTFIYRSVIFACSANESWFNLMHVAFELFEHEDTGINYTYTWKQSIG